MKDKLQGYKMILTVLSGMLVAFMGWAFGPVDIAGIAIPQFDFSQMMKYEWAGLILIFGKMGLNRLAELLRELIGNGK